MLIEFLDSGKAEIPRNRVLEFRFTSAVMDGQDFNERLKITNVQSVPGGPSDFTKAFGTYIVSAERVTFVPRLPEEEDRSDAGFRSLANYHVFLKAGGDSLESTTGSRIAVQQEFLFDTSEFFEDPIPTQPPRALRLLARGPDGLGGEQVVDLSRLAVDPVDQLLLSNQEVLDRGNWINPGASGPPQYETPWAFELYMSEPIDPLTATDKLVQITEIRDGVMESEIEDPSDPGAADGSGGLPVEFAVPLTVTVRQNDTGVSDAPSIVIATPLQTLVDNARYEIRFQGQILGIDFRKQFQGENGLTGDGTAKGPQVSQVGGGNEVGGLGYTSEFIVADRPAIESFRTLAYNPLEDGIFPEVGQTTDNEDLFNSAIYSPSGAEGQAVGFLSAFGSGIDGPKAVSGGLTDILDTGDTPNEFLGNPFTTDTADLDPNDNYNNQSSPTKGFRNFDSRLHTEWEWESLVVSSSSTLRITGVNPARFRVAGVVEVNGTIDASGEPGLNSGAAGKGAAGGFSGGRSTQGVQLSTATSACSSFDAYLTTLNSSQNRFPWTEKGEGPGRGNQGGEAYARDTTNQQLGSGRITGTGGGGGGHATAGGKGEDVHNANGGTGTPGPACGWGTNSSVIGVRGVGGPSYGDREIVDVTGGGSGGGGGGGVHVRQFASAGAVAGGGGGGGGGSLEILSAGPINVTGSINVAGGQGGKGGLRRFATFNYNNFGGSGGGGAGGSLVLVSGDDISLTGFTPSKPNIDARGGAGGISPEIGTAISSCTGCNAGGAGGKGFLFLMDQDGLIDGLIPSGNGQYFEDDNFAFGVLTISTFETARFSSTAAITELFVMPAANPRYQDLVFDEDLSITDILGNVKSATQTINIFATSARADLADPLLPDLSTEPEPQDAVLVAQVAWISGGSSVTYFQGSMPQLNPDGTAKREAFVRIRADYVYGVGKEAALGPFATMDEFTVRFSFNGAAAAP